MSEPTPSPAPRKSRARLLVGLGVLVLLGVAIGLYGDWALRRATRVILEKQLAALLNGEVHVDRIASLSLGHVRAEGVTVLDAQKRPVLRGKILELGLDLTALPSGMRFTHGLLSEARVRAIPTETGITLFDALMPKDTGTDGGSGASFTLDFEHVHITKTDLVGSVPGLEGLHVLDLDVRADFHVATGFQAAVRSARGRMIAPYASPVTIDHATVGVTTGPFRVDATARLTRGEEHVRARLNFTTPSDARDALDLTIGLEPVTTEWLREIGIATPETLIGELRGTVKLVGALNAPHLVAQIETDGGTLRIHGDLPRDGVVQVHVESPRLSLPDVLGYAPPVVLQFGVVVTAPPDEPVRVDAQAPWIELFGIMTHDAKLLGRYAQGRFDIEYATLRYAGGRFNGDGWVDENADYALHLRSNVPDTRRDPTLRQMGLGAAVQTDVRIARRGSVMSASGTVGLAALDYQGYGATTLTLRGDAKVNDDDPTHPEVRLEADGQGVVIPGFALGELRIKLRGARGRYTSDLSVRDPNGRFANTHVEVRERGQSFEILASPLELGVAGREPWRALADVVLDPDGVELRKVELVNGAQRLDVSGRFSYSKAYRVDARLQSFDVGGLRELLGVDLADLDGLVDGQLALTGVPGHPRIDAQGSLRNGTFLGMTDLTLLTSLVLAEGRFDVESELVLPDGSRLAVYAGGEPGPGPTWGAQVGSGNYQFGLDFEQVPFEVARPWLEWLGLEPPGGRVSAMLRGAGTFADPTLEITSRVEGLAIRDWTPLDLDLRARHDGKRFDLDRLRVSDPVGEVVSFTGSIDATVAELAAYEDLRASLATRPFDLTVRAAPRVLGTLPKPITAEWPMTESGELHVTQTPDGPAVELTAQVGWPRTQKGVDACRLDRHPELTVLVRAQGNAVSAEGSVHVDDELIAWGNASAEAPITKWITGEVAPRIVPTRVTLRSTMAATEELPILCEHMAGPLRGELVAEDIFAKPPELRFELSSPNLQLVPSESQRQRLGNLRDARVTGNPFAIALHGEVERDQVLFAADLDEGGGRELHAYGAIPRGAFRAPEERPKGLVAEGRVTFEQFELSSVLLALPLPARTSATVNGSARVAYAFDTEGLELEGDVHLQDGRLAITALGQELSQIDAKLRMRGNTLTIQSFEARDFSGKISAKGDLVFDTATHARTELRMNVEDFPIRREGAQVSKLSGVMALRADVTDERTRAELRMDGVRVKLPNDIANDVQDLDVHPDILVKGEDRPLPPADPYVFEIRVVADPAFRIQRTDLSAEVLTDVTVRYREPQLIIVGNAEIRRGQFELYGKRFDLIESRIAFDGNDQLDPLVSLYAVYKAGSDEIGVRVEGRLSDPRVSFTHSNPAITDQGEIIAQLLGARRDSGTSTEQDATGAASTFLAGATAGLLTEEVRKQFGGALPVFAIESGNQAFRNARIRAGVQLDQFVEKRLGPLRHVVRGAYIEGFVAPGADSSGTSATTTTNMAPQSRGGGLLELRFPRDFVGTVEYRPVQNWRLDVAWEP